MNNLSSELLPRDKWKLDSKVTNCDHCDRSFISLFRRKHHCRRCGNVFCSDCSNRFMDGTLFGDFNEKQVRVCNRCYDQLIKIMKSQTQQSSLRPIGEYNTSPRPMRSSYQPITSSLGSSLEPPQLITSKSMNLPTLSPSKQIEETQNQEAEFNPEVEEVIISTYLEDTIRTNDMDLLKQSLREKSCAQLEVICEHILKSLLGQQQNVDKWRVILSDFIKKAVEDVQYSSLSGQPMDINCYVKTKTIPYQDDSITGYFKGFIFRKNVALKKMNIQLNRPKIMIIVGALDMNETAVTQFEDYISKEKKIIHDYIDKIKDNYRPNLILVEKSANKIALDQCYKYGITVVHNIKLYLLKKIAKCTEAKAFRLEKLDEYIRKNNKKIVGYCEHVLFRNFPKPQNQAQKDQIYKDSTLMFIETADGHNGVTITLSGPSEDLLGKLKQCICGCMRLAKHFELEKHMIMTELQLKNGKKLVGSGDFSKFLFEKIPLKDIIKTEIPYVKVNYVQADLRNFNDIKDVQALEQYKKEFSYQSRVIEFFAEMCNIPAEKGKALYYSNDDVTLGAFIILRISNMDNRCRHCKLPLNSHVSIYYTAGKYVRISVDKQSKEQVMLRKEQSSISSNQQEEDSKLFTSKDLLKIFEQNYMNEKKKTRIETYIECNTCGQKLTDTVALSHQNLEFSFLRFLQHLFLTPPLPRETQQICEHNHLQRVFFYNDSVVKVMVGDLNVYSTKMLNYNDNSVKESLEIWEQGFIRQKKEELLNKIGYISKSLMNMVPKSLVKSEIELLHKTIIQLKEDFEKTIQETQFSNFLQIEKLSHEQGLQMKAIYQKILEHKKKRELNPDFKTIITNKFVDKESMIKTVQDLDKFENNSYTQSLLITNSEKVHTQSYNNSKHDTETNEIGEMINLDDMSNQLRLNQKPSLIPDTNNLTDLMIPNNDGGECHTPLGGRPQMSKAIQQNSLRDLDRPIENQSISEKEFNFQKEWNLSAFLAESSKLLRAQTLYEFVPIYENQPLSYLAFSLNHQKYISEIYQKENFHTLDNTPEQTKYLLQFLLQQRNDNNNNNNNNFQQATTDQYREKSVDLTFRPQTSQDRDCFIIKINYDQDKRIDKSPNLAAFQVKESVFTDDYGERSLPTNNQSMINNNAPQVRKSKYAEILIYFPTQFEALRKLCGISLGQFIKSISSTALWSAQGGKSASRFYKSKDELFIFKKLEQDKEFLMFKKFALDYFKHMHRHFSESKPSLLTKIFGMFEIRDRGSVEYYLVMENLLYGMGDANNLSVYDLKGSETNRWEKKKKGVLLDTNFRIDRNAEPIPLQKENYRYTDRAFQSDCKFFNKQNVIDYSLLLIIDNKNCKLRMGIIDYLRFYTWDKETEHYLKYLLKGGMVPTIVNPADYKRRFIGVMSKYFIAV